MFVWSADCSLKLRAFGAIPPSLTAGPLPLTMAAGGHGFREQSADRTKKSEVINAESKGLQRR